MYVKGHSIIDFPFPHTNIIEITIFEPDVKIGSELIDTFLECYHIFMLGLVQAHIQIFLCLDI